MTLRTVLSAICLAVTMEMQAHSLVNAATANSHSDLLLWYKTPATKWIEALPIGNGRFGAMVFGQPAKEQLQLNDVTVWSDSPQLDADRQDACPPPESHAGFATARAPMI